jgi:hypothetical protein
VRIVDAFKDVAKGVVSGTKKLLPTKKPIQPKEKSWLDETAEEYGKRLIQRRSRKY